MRLLSKARCEDVKLLREVAGRLLDAALGAAAVIT